MASHPTQAAAVAHPFAPTVENGLNALTGTITGRNIAFAKLGEIAGDLATNVAISLLILLATIWLSKWAQRLTQAMFGRLPHGDPTLRDFIASLVRYAVVVIGGIAILNRLGFQTASIITVLGAASLAIGLALQGALSNLAAGVMILLFRPYHVGDMVTIAGRMGTVKRLDLFNTELMDVDGLKVMVPNGKGFGDVITNYTAIERRRIQLKFGIDYADPIGEAIEIILGLARADGRILPDPAPWCMVTELADSQVTLELRAWTHVSDYWTARFDMLKAVKEAFDAAGITIPYPTQTSIPKGGAVQPGDARVDSAPRPPTP